MFKGWSWELPSKRDTCWLYSPVSWYLFGWFFCSVSVWLGSCPFPHYYTYCIWGGFLHEQNFRCASLKFVMWSLFGFWCCFGVRLCLLESLYFKEINIKWGYLLGRKVVWMYTCPVATLVAWMRQVQGRTGVLFQHESNLPLTQYHFWSVVKQALFQAGFPTKTFGTYHFQTGAALVAVQLGFSEPELQRTGHRRMKAFQS